jgi:MoaA/NifB/PqqE/SkfB family radical SAM enzyme
MKLIGIYTPGYSELKEKWFLPSVKDKIEIEIHLYEPDGSGKYMEPDRTKTELFKSAVIIQSIRDNPGKILICSDVDIEFFRPVGQKILTAIQSSDIVCQLDDPYGSLSTGFFAMRANRLTLQLWEQVHESVKSGHSIQSAFNHIIKTIQGLRYGYLPVEFFSAGTFNPDKRNMSDRVYIPQFPVMFHANRATGPENKKILLRKVKSAVDLGRAGIYANNILYGITNFRINNHRLATGFVAGFNSKAATNRPSFSQPRRVGLEASTVCQLACRTCPTSTGLIRKTLGPGFLSPAHLDKFLRDHPWITEIELSNWGEVFLNPRLQDIFKVAKKYAVLLRMENGVNLNTANDEILEDVVRYGIRSITCSIDGASPETYAIYRVKGNFEKVIENIKKINRFKEKHRTPFPNLQWQFVTFGHNEHEIEKARRLAADLDMKFKLKLSWEDLYYESFSPVNDRDRIRSEMPSGVSDRKEFGEKFGKVYIGDCCNHLWLSPRINFDGRLLGCCINYWDDFGNVFEQGIEKCLNSEKMKASRDLLMGFKTERKDLPCLKCKVYESRVQLGSYVTLQDLKELL